ncbi:MAG: hypothetical protein ACREPI_07185 [Candidatus Dormibacterales bacterium]
MLAYLLWHRPRPGASPAAYEEALLRFEAGLQQDRPDGFAGCATARVAGASWAGPSGRGYEDWYLLEGSYAMDALNDAATAGACRAPHAEVAALSEGAAAGLMKLRAGAPLLTARHAAWFAKPAGLSYEDLGARLERHLEAAGASLWRRQMVLGPALEFCLLSASPVELAGAGIEVVAVRREPLEPSPEVQ